MGKVIKVRLWDELPEVIESGKYLIGGTKVIVKERVLKSTLKILVKYCKYLSKRYGPSD